MNKLVSIIIPVYNQLHLTRNCIASVKEHTDEAYEIIVVNNGSTDKTKSVLNKLPFVKLIDNKTNMGFAKACNQGIRASSGELVLLLNNDTLVSKNWLSNLIRCIKSDSKIGIVGPTSNFVGGQQLVKAPSLNRHKYNKEFTNQSNPHRWFDTDFISGFCMLIKREVIDRIGLLDERFNFGSFEDNDYCLRAMKAGYRLVVAGDTFVYHLGSQTFKGNRLDDKRIGAKNRLLYNEKWSIT